MWQPLNIASAHFISWIGSTFEIDFTWGGGQLLWKGNTEEVFLRLQRISILNPPRHAHKHTLGASKQKIVKWQCKPIPKWHVTNLILHWPIWFHQQKNILNGFQLRWRAVIMRGNYVMGTPKAATNIFPESKFHANSRTALFKLLSKMSLRDSEIKALLSINNLEVRLALSICIKE